jgi:alkane 1-monooxygenase
MTTDMMDPPAVPDAALAAALPSFRWSDLRFLLVLLLPGLTLLGVWLDPAASAWRAAAFYLSVVALDALLPGGRLSPPPARNSLYFVLLMRLYVPLQLALQLSAAWTALHSSWPLALGLALSVGFVAGAQGITVAHELGHSRHRMDRFLGWVLMTSVSYAHFMVEHYRGHHPRAATLDDPASARRGESLWRFLPRTLWGGLRSAWALESVQRSQLKLSMAASPLVWAFAAQAVLWLLAAWAGPVLLLFWLVQAVFAVWLLETVNYIEHYGLLRGHSGGRREAFGAMHAWNADHLVSNSLLINLQRHSDHHMHPWKPYASLQRLAPTPQLPTGYAGCLVIAAIPTLWFRVMHPRLGS